MTQNQNNPVSRRIILLATDRSHSIIGEVVDGKTNAIAYSAYGEQSAQQEIETRLGFNGQLRETNIGWYLLGNGYRAYNPRLMRFHSPDSWSPFGRGGSNAYMYCGGEPVMNSDPTGHYFGWLLSSVQKLTSGFRTITTQTTNIMATAASQSAGTVSRGISGISGVVYRAKQTVTNAFSFDVEALKATQTPFPRASGVVASSRSNVSSTLDMSKSPAQAHGYANRTALSSTKPKTQTHGYANRTELPSNKPKPQTHGYSNRTELSSNKSKSPVSMDMGSIRT